MEEEYATIVYVELAENIYVPYEWPIRGIENFILVLAEKIISQFDFASPILQVKNIPTRLIRRPKTNGSIHVFEKVSKEEMVGSFVYDIVLPKEEDSIHMEMTLGSGIKKGSWPNYVTSFCPRDNKISYYLIPPKYSGECCLTQMLTNIPCARHGKLDGYSNECRKQVAAATRGGVV